MFYYIVETLFQISEAEKRKDFVKEERWDRKMKTKEGGKEKRKEGRLKS